MLLQIASEILKEGAISPEILERIFDYLLKMALAFVQKLIFVIIVFFVGRWVIKWVKKIFTRFINKRASDATVKNFLISVIDALLKIFLFLVIINILGLSTTSFAAILAAGGLAIGMAMKDNLSNFAGGVLLLMNSPFKVGDRIAAQNMIGNVQSIGILYTVVSTADNRSIYIPNGPLSTGSIENYSTQENRRVDITLEINNGFDINNIKNILIPIIDNNHLILKDPAPYVGVTKLNNGYIDMTLQAWVKNSDYAVVNTNLNETIYEIFSQKGVYVPSSLTVKLVDNNQ